MSESFNIYCDESCHLENDHQKAMVLGAAWCPLDKTREIKAEANELVSILTAITKTTKENFK